MNSLLSAIKAFVLKSRPAYKDYIGNGKYDVKKLPEECVPDSVNDDIVRVRSMAKKAQITADAADNAAVLARRKANAADNTANLAQLTANEIKNAVQPTDEYNNGIKIKTYIGFKDVLEQSGTPIMSSDTNGCVYFIKSSDQTGANLVIGYRDNSDNLAGFCASIGKDGLELSENSKIYAPIKPSVRGPIISIYNDSNRAYVEFTKNACLVLPSYTQNSTKKFKITVDDTGTISATEVT